MPKLTPDQIRATEVINQVDAVRNGVSEALYMEPGELLETPRAALYERLDRLLATAAEKEAWAVKLDPEVRKRIPKPKIAISKGEVPQDNLD